MSKLIYKKMSLFNAPEGSVLVHACNGQGVWGSGIAKAFKEKFPPAYARYHEGCKNGAPVGSMQMYTTANTDGDVYWIGNLINSSGFGSTLDTEDEIIVNTVLAMEEFCKEMKFRELNTVYSNKFNSGLFKVPWTKTEGIIKVFVNRYNLTWIICDPNLEE